MTQKEEKKNQRIGLITSIGVHVAVLILFLLMMAWRAPNPPFPEYGIELNFGLDNQGYGEVQPETPASESEATEQPTEEKVDDAEQPQEEVAPVEAKEATEQPVAKTESPVVVKESNKETKPTPTVEDKPVEKQPTKVVKKEEKLIATYPADGKKDDGKTVANNGDNPNTIGDKGSKEGSLDAKALYGNQGGGGGGPALDLAGWDWDEIPRPAIPGNESDGRIEFEIKVDAEGAVIGYRVLQRSLSIEAERACREAIAKLTFSKKPGAVVPDVSVGKITFVVRTR
ncbi:MAG TPA: hypothetical protein VIS49_00705 [Cyclobacteriaceae bacterium]